MRALSPRDFEEARTSLMNHSIFVLPVLRGNRSCWVRLGTSVIFTRFKSNVMERLTCNEVLGHSKGAFLCAVSAVKPAKLVKSAVKLQGNSLLIKGEEFQLKQPCHIIGFGKAVLEMALTLEEILGRSLKSGVVSVPVGLTTPELTHSRIEVLQGALNNMPDKMAENNAKRILSIVENLGPDDVLLVLISGGGSALLPLPLPPIRLEEKLQVIKQLANAGANISQLNSVRKRLSSVKGGRLALAAQPATVISLILSDVIGDPIDIIASGPTTISSDSASAAWNILCNFHLENCIPLSVKQCLTAIEDEPIVLDGGHTHNFVIGNNKVAIDAAVQEMSDVGYSVCSISGSIEGNVVQVAKFYALLAFQVCETLAMGTGNPLRGLDQPFHTDAVDKVLAVVKDSSRKKGTCLVAGGEITVNVKGTGIGGRNQELALRFAEESRFLAEKHPLLEQYEVFLLSAGTDGIDGPTSAAGAFGFAGQLESKPDYKNYVLENDSHTFYSKLDQGRNLIITGHTGTNVMDIHILTITAK